MMRKKITIITKYFLPNINVDSDAVYDMVKGLLNEVPNLDITIITSNISYKGELTPNSKYSSSILEMLTIKKVSPFLVNNKTISDFLLGFQLVSLAKKIGNKSIISLSNPPLIALWHSLLLSNYNLFYWSFDIFPQALAADKLIKYESPIYKVLNWLTYRNKPDNLISLGQYQFNFLKKLYGQISNKIILPCGIHNLYDEKQPQWKKNDLITIGYLGNIGRAHSPVFLENVIMSVANKSHIKFILSIYGFHKKRIDDFVANLDPKNITIVESIAKGQLRFIDVHLVSLLPEWTNISVPSKAVSAICSGSSLWYCGLEESDTFDLFQKCSFISKDDIKSVNSTLNLIDLNSIEKKKNEAQKIKEELYLIEKKAFKDIVKYAFREL